MNLTNYPDLLGLCGSLLLTGAFTRAAFNEAFREKAAFLILNAIGSALLIIPAVSHASYPALSICTFWIISSIASLMSPKKCLSHRWLIGTNVCFAAALTTMVISGDFGFLSLLGFASVEIFVLSYSAFIAQLINRKSYLVWTFLGNAIFIPSLYIDHNIPSLALQLYCLIMSVIGLCSKEKASLPSPVTPSAGVQTATNNDQQGLA
ncbi:hypothetical protein YA0089_25945 [Pseudomonas viridiflava]|uniref:CBU_0592 family membrane protein n=1 Tax=Pseudomonas viridiflava TaxID=33069 RepID=UPI0018E5EC5F|nr:hypothetical protein [Pseudomonas viridiflava]MBI6727058.1 hypothetical protein [Pseudomonas viridiflava]